MQEVVAAAKAPHGRVAADVAPLADADASAAAKRPTGIPELDRVLGGGLARGGAYLVAGEPGIGKSTLLLQVARAAASAGERVLLVCGEETPEQVRERADRLGGAPPGLLATRATSVREVLDAVGAAAPSIVVVDSVQALVHPDLPGVAGSVGQVRASADALVRDGKARGATVILVGQATKDGQVAGPRTLEHLVDAVLWFEGDSERTLRLLRATKNRFGPAHEVGCFAMTARGLREVADPSRLFVGDRAHPVPGVAVVPLVEGNRPLLVEVQALVGPSAVQSPRRTVAGVDGQRCALLIAVLERRCRLRIAGHDVFIGTMGGVRVAEPAADLAVALAVASSFRDAPLRAGTAAVGEVGLSGEVRAVPEIARRIDEAARLGFRRVIVPSGASVAHRSDVEAIPVPDVVAALSLIERATKPPAPAGA
jgi:DNA repair protein RadA/Sms